MHPMHFVTLHWNGTAECFHSMWKKTNIFEWMLCMQNAHIHRLENGWKTNIKTRPNINIYTYRKTTFEYCGHNTRIWSSFHTFNVKMNCMHAERRGAKFEEPIRIAAQSHAIHAEILHTNPSKMIRVEKENCSSLSFSLCMCVLCMFVFVYLCNLPSTVMIKYAN